MADLAWPSSFCEVKARVGLAVAFAEAPQCRQEVVRAHLWSAACEVVLEKCIKYKTPARAEVYGATMEGIPPRTPVNKGV